MNPSNISLSAQELFKLTSLSSQCNDSHKTQVMKEIINLGLLNCWNIHYYNMDQDVVTWLESLGYVITTESVDQFTKYTVSWEHACE